MMVLHWSNIQSKLTFVLLTICKYFLKDIILLLMFLAPIPLIEGIPQQILTGIAMLNLPLTLFMLLSLLLFWMLFLFSDSVLVHKEILLVLQTITPWIDALSFSILIVTVYLLFINLSQNIALMFCNILTLILVILIQFLYNALFFTKAPRSNNLLDR